MNIVSLKRAAVKLAITADLVLLLAALGSLNIPTTITALLAHSSALKRLLPTSSQKERSNPPCPVKSPSTVTPL